MPSFFSPFLSWLERKGLKYGALFLLFFIPVYPKLPLFDIRHTWVYIRLEDVLVALLAAGFMLSVFRRKNTLRTPLTFPILLYWLVGGISAIHALIVFAPSLPELFPHLIILHYLRRIEYMLLFFIVVSTVKSWRDARDYLIVFFVMASVVLLYGFGQKFIGFPAFLTMNEEFAKGTPLYLDAGARIPSTFGGHYDLGAFLILALSLAGSLLFVLSSMMRKSLLFILSIGGFTLLLFTESRVSFFSLGVSFIVLMVLHQKKWLLLPLALIGVIGIVAAGGLSERFGKTFRIEQVVYDVRTNTPIARVEDFKYTKPVHDVLNATNREQKGIERAPTPTPYEELPLGSGFIDMPVLYGKDKSGIPLDPKLIYEEENTGITELARNYIVKPTVIYDISFTTRSQGQWPKAMRAFQRNILIGSGYSIVDVAADNNYLRILAETGLLGFFSYFLVFGIYFLIVHQAVRKKALPLVRAVLIGLAAGISGLLVNAVLIDVFEASKVAFVLWSLIGVGVGLYIHEVNQKESLLTDAHLVLRSRTIAFLCIMIVAFLVLYPLHSHFFVGDDFTWLRWAISAVPSDLIKNITSSDGFFYRPFTKALAYGLYPLFGLQPAPYHTLSIIIHGLVSCLVYGIAHHLSGKRRVGLLAGLFFLLHPIHAETLFWMSGYSGLFAALFYLASVYTFIRWHGNDVKKRRKQSGLFRISLYMGSIIFFVLALGFYELSVTLPLVVGAYILFYAQEMPWRNKFLSVLPFTVVLGAYVYLRNVVAESHLLSGDYSYNVLLFPFNAAGNILGYAGELVAGFAVIPWYDYFRVLMREQVSAAVLVSIAGLVLLGFFTRMHHRQIRWHPLIIFSTAWFIMALLPVMGLGNIAERYLYIPSVGYSMALSYILVRISDRPNFWLRGSVVLLTVIILTGYISGMRSAMVTWKKSGDTAETILRAVTVSHRSLVPGATIYYLNVPIRIGRAWVYPVGLRDALWVHYRDDSMRVITDMPQEYAREQQNTENNVLIFLYDRGAVYEITRGSRR